ncbi:ABC transporter substrate-binding protein [Microbacterium immunditiarum]|uniref:Raffinose/stachyose/melibiose transport system substrate-binding protein n=1 Tax=Microbacterium immunditiarum TaxID=337480 RepID=A0A7Y9KG53_9MICO|nr:extracellular solute-binding protein [Microbacterium immunditiarum]NYE18067.1 raffinose/stachyose/melibiose transport system substrate-binding protein [Microbacterium immunditiarum]
MRFKKAIIGVTAAVTLVLAGCSAGESDDPVDEEVTLSVWGWNPDATTAPKYFDAFEEENPNIKVDYRVFPYADYLNALRLGVTTSDGPDVFGIQVGAFAEQFAPLADDQASALEAEHGAGWSDMFVGADQFNIDGAQIAVPWFDLAPVGVMWVNQTLLDSLGLEVPKTLDELADLSAAAKAAGVTGFAMGAQEGWANLDLFQVIANQIEPGLFQEAVTGEAPFDSEQFVTALTVWGELFTNGVMPEGALAMPIYPDVNDIFNTNQGVTAGFIRSIRDTTLPRLEQYAEQYGDPSLVDTIFMPYDFPAFVEGAELGSLIGGPDVGWAISKESEKKDAAATLVNWLTSSETAMSLLSADLRSASYKEAPGPDLSTVVTPEQKAAVEDLLARSKNLVGAREVSNPEVKDALIAALAAVAAGTQTPQDAATAVQTVIDSQTN